MATNVISQTAPSMPEWNGEHWSLYLDYAIPLNVRNLSSDIASYFQSALVETEADEFRWFGDDEWIRQIGAKNKPRRIVHVRHVSGENGPNAMDGNLLSFQRETLEVQISAGSDYRGYKSARDVIWNIYHLVIADPTGGTGISLTSSIAEPEFELILLNNWYTLPNAKPWTGDVTNIGDDELRFYRSNSSNKPNSGPGIAAGRRTATYVEPYSKPFVLAAVYQAPNNNFIWVQPTGPWLQGDNSLAGKFTVKNDVDTETFNVYTGKFAQPRIVNANLLSGVSTTPYRGILNTYPHNDGRWQQTYFVYIGSTVYRFRRDIQIRALNV